MGSNGGFETDENLKTTKREGVKKKKRKRRGGESYQTVEHTVFAGKHRRIKRRGTGSEAKGSAEIVKKKGGGSGEQEGRGELTSGGEKTQCQLSSEKKAN